MTCVHKINWSVKRPEDCRFRLSVSHYKDRIVAPAEYTGATEVTPSDDTQVLATKDKLVKSNITVNPAPTETLATSENGTFVPSFGNVGFSSVTVDVEPVLESLSITENGLFLPESGVDGFDRVSVDIPVSLVLIDTIVVDGVNGVRTDIDMSWFDTYDYVVMVPDLTFSGNDWPYIVSDATTGGAYADRMTSMGVQQSLFLGMVGSTLWGTWFRDTQSRPNPFDPVSYLYWYLYSASNTMTGTIKMYGIKVTS